MKLRHLPAATALALISLAVGLDPAEIWGLPALEWTARVLRARRRRMS